jgi:hypothetical protein
MIVKSLRIPALLAALLGVTLGRESALPPIGDSVPQLTAYDAEGKAFNLADRLKGHYSVIVFGCLT